MITLSQYKTDAYKINLGSEEMGKVWWAPRMGCWRLMFNGVSVGEFKTFEGAKLRAMSEYAEI